MLGKLRLRRLADDRLVIDIGNNGGHQPIARCVAQHFRMIAGHHGDNRIRGAEIDADRLAALQLVGCRCLPRLMNLQQHQDITL